jgi:hypothetical protein
VPTAAWAITPGQVRAVFAATRGGELPDLLGLGAIFRTNDGSSSPDADVSTSTGAAPPTACCSPAA